MNLRKLIEEYKPYDEVEKCDKEYFLKFIDTFDDVLTRNNIFGHFSASALVVNSKRDKLLVVYHIINDGWVSPGGHADGDADLLSVAHREVFEETGLDAKILSKKPININANAVLSHKKRGKQVPAHIHFDVMYLMEADDSKPLTYRDDESRGVKWISFDEAYGEDIVPFIRPIHRKLINRIKEDNG